MAILLVTALVIFRGGAARAAEAAAVGSTAAMAADPDAAYPPRSPRLLSEPDRRYSYSVAEAAPSLGWLALQFVPSPEFVVGRVRQVQPTGDSVTETAIAGGLRWQLSPLVWSWGTNRRVSRWRWFVVDPLARHSGSVEISGSLEYIYGHADRWVVRPGLRAYLPIADRGEYLSVSVGTSAYVYDEKPRVAYDVGAYILFGLFGAQLTVAPAHGPLSAIGTFRIRYF